jgi:hypothetical protein
VYDIGAFEFVAGGGGGGGCSPISVNGTRITLSLTSICDTNGNSWGLGAGTTPNMEVQRNGTLESGFYGSQILFCSSIVYADRFDGMWYRWTGSAFVLVGATDPCPFVQSTDTPLILIRLGVFR